MTEIELNNEYFEWMCQLVCNERYSRRLSYQKLLRHLHNIDFQYMLPMDGNRAEDGIDHVMLKHRNVLKNKRGDIVTVLFF